MINKNTLNDLRKIIYRNSDLLRKNKTRLSNFLQPINKILSGGGNRVLSIKYDNNKYEFLELRQNKIFNFILASLLYQKNQRFFDNKSHDDNYFILYSKNDEDCVTVIIN